MKIVEVNTYTVRPRWGFVEIVTDEGLTGWGEPVLEGHCATVLACVQEMKPYLIGKIYAVELFCSWQALHSSLDFIWEHRREKRDSSQRVTYCWFQF